MKCQVAHLLPRHAPCGIRIDQAGRDQICLLRLGQLFLRPAAHVGKRADAGNQTAHKRQTEQQCSNTTSFHKIYPFVQ